MAVHSRGTQALLLFRAEATTDRYRGVFGVSEQPIVSSDIIGDSRASIADS
ncbi:hypothetical protein [Streptomyces cahuitamycinicus]|uniref:hypothetical protein n=1 Tax=Streptomyces cahuitamycinicus TaxID=2070367 RepID=UPI0015E0CEC2|nr:hypothetical protein [Streptomyces cahuitamycinicus]